MNHSYRWVILLASFLQSAACYTAWYSFSVFLVALVDEFGWSRAEVSLAQSALVIISGLGAPLAGAAVDRFGPRHTLVLGALCLGGGVALSSQLQTPWHFYLLYGVLGGIGVAACGWVPVTAMLVAWFQRQRASALGVASAGIGFGIMLFVPLTQHLVTIAGWRTAFLAQGVTIGLVGLVAALLSKMPAVERRRGVARSEPADDPLVVDRTWVATVWSVGRAVRTGRFWLVAWTFFLGSFGTQQILVHQVAILSDFGFDRLFAAFTIGVVGISSVAAKLSWGYISDRLGREPSYSIGMGIIVLSMVLLWLGRETSWAALAVSFAILLGLGYAVTSVLSPATVADCFQGRHFGAVFGLVAIGHGVGGALGAWTTGLLRDTTGGYLATLVLTGAAVVCAAVLCWLAAPRKVRLTAGVAARRGLLAASRGSRAG